MIFSEEDIKSLEKLIDVKVEDPILQISEGLSLSHYFVDENKPYINKMYDWAKRLLVETAKKRGISADFDAKFNVNEIIENDKEVPNLSVEDYEDLDKLKRTVEELTREMDDTKKEQFRNNFDAQKVSVPGNVRLCMAKYIERIKNKLYDFDKEISKKEESGPAEFDPFNSDEVSQEPTTDFSWAAGTYDPGVFEIEPDEDSEWKFEGEYGGDEGEFVPEFEKDNESEDKGDEEVTDEELVDLIKYINTYPELKLIRENSRAIFSDLTRTIKSEKIQEFKDNKEFYDTCKKIMEHDRKKNRYLFHGTQAVVDAEKILKQGLGMESEALVKTTFSFYDFSYSMDKVLLYERGVADAVGRDAIVIIDQPIDENGQYVNIVRDKTDKDDIHISGSGLQGLDVKVNYVIDKKYIVGMINKRDKEVVFNEAYYDYERFSKQKEEGSKTTISAKEGLKNAIGNVDVEMVDKADNDMVKEEEKEQENKDV